jgi:hypothetical protein
LWSLDASRGPDHISINETTGTEVLSNKQTATGLALVLRDKRLPNLPEPAGISPNLVVKDRQVRVQVAPGRYALQIDGREVARASAKEWAQGMLLDRGPEFDQLEVLRQAIVAKNRLLFYRWRPQNETYIYGFRKHEQGQNAVEIPRFDPLVVDKEAEISRLKVPVPHTYEWVPVEEEPAK